MKLTLHIPPQIYFALVIRVQSLPKAVALEGVSLCPVMIARPSPRALWGECHSPYCNQQQESSFLDFPSERQQSLRNNFQYLWILSPTKDSTSPHRAVEIQGSKGRCGLSACLDLNSYGDAVWTTPMDSKGTSWLRSRIWYC